MSTHRIMISHGREIARKAGLTLKVDQSLKIKGRNSYMIIERETGLKVYRDPMTLEMAYETLLSNH